MKTGTDTSIAECRTSGYPVVEHGKTPLHPQRLYRLTISNPEAWTDSGTRALMAQHRPIHLGHPIPIWKVDGWFSYEELWKRFMAKSAEESGSRWNIKAFCDFENCPLPHPQDGRRCAPGGDPEKPRPTFGDFVTLAGIIDSYCGLE